MDCSCGSGNFKPASAKCDNTVLKYQICESCGRVGGEELFIDGGRVASDIEARRRYQEVISWENKP